MLVASMLWYRNFRHDLEGIGFKFNPFGPRVVNRIVNGSQHTIRYHVGDVILSRLKAKVNNNFAIWAQGEYGSVKSVEVKCGKTHKFLGMTLDFSKAGECRVLQNGHIEDIVRF